MTKENTFEKYIQIVTDMRKTNNYHLDLSKYTPEETYAIANLLKNDYLFDFFEGVRNVEISKLAAAIEYCNAKEKMEKAMKTLEKRS